jgi:PAS domain S-box-containing protein
MTIGSRDAGPSPSAEAAIEAELRAVQRIADVGLYSVEVGSGALVWSEQMFRIFDRDAATFTPTVARFVELVDPADADRLRGTVDPQHLALCVGAPWGTSAQPEIEFRVTRSDGTTRWMRGRSEIAFGARGEAVFVRGIVQDVTRAKAQEEARAEADHRYRLLVHGSPYGILEIDRDGRILSANSAAVRHFRPSRESDRIGTTFLAAIAERDREPVASHLRRAAAGLSSEIEAHAESGRRFLLQLVPLRESRGLVVTELRRVEAELRRHEASLEQAQRIAHLGSWERDLVTGEVVWSDETFRILDVDPSRRAASHEAFFALVHPEDRDAVERRYAEALAQRAPCEIEHRLKLPDGRVKWVVQRYEASHGPDGRALRVVGTLQDVTERRRTAAALHATQQRLALVFDSTTDLQILFAVGPGDRLVVEAANRACREALRRAFADRAIEPIGSDWGELLASLGIGADAVARARERLHRVVDERATESFAYSLETPAGALRYEASVWPVFEDGVVTHLLWNARDVTLRARAEEELRTHSEVLVSMGEGVNVSDEAGIIRFTNPALDRMFGYDAGELVGRPVDVLNAGSAVVNEPRNRAIVAEIAANGIWEGEFFNRRKDGSTFVSRARITRVDRPGRVLYVSVQEDVTRHKEAEERLRASLREKDLLLREVHHRVKNNLQIVTSLLSLQRGTAKDAAAHAVLSDCEDRVRAVALIHEQLYRSTDLTSVELGAYACALVAKIAQTHAGGHRLEVVCESPLWVTLDAAIPIGLITHELITNATKHAFPGRRGSVRLTLASSDGWLVVRVRDDGVGIPAGDRTGPRTLGFSLVRALAEQLDGRFSLRSEGGAEATLEVPVDRLGLGAGRSA